MVNLGSLFDGIGGGPLCAVLCGAEPVWASEIEDKAISITKRHFPNMLHLGDITKINGAEIEPVDIIVGGSPCTDLSVAGKREGLAGARSGLFMDQVRIVKEMLNATDGQYPRYMVWENVPGAFSSNKGEDFRVVLEEIARIADQDADVPLPAKGKWAKAGAILGNGYSIAWRVLDAQFFGVPQRRRRIYLVIDLAGQSAPEILFERESVSGHPAPSRTPWQGTAGDAEKSAGKPIWDIGDRRRVVESVDVAPTLLSKMGTGGNNVPIIKNVICLQGNGIDRKDTAGCAGKGWNDEGVCYTLNTVDRPAVVAFPKRKCLLPKRTTCVGCWAIKTCKPTYQDITGPLMANSHPGSYSGQDAYTDMFVAHQTVRRLTPMECCRLQGFPDGWTELDHEGKLVSDSVRYKALGNSFAVPCALFVIGGCIDNLRRTNS